MKQKIIDTQSANSGQGRSTAHYGSGTHSSRKADPIGKVGVIGGLMDITEHVDAENEITGLRSNSRDRSDSLEQIN